MCVDISVGVCVRHVSPTKRRMNSKIDRKVASVICQRSKVKVTDEVISVTQRYKS